MRLTSMVLAVVPSLLFLGAAPAVERQEAAAGWSEERSEEAPALDGAILDSGYGLPGMTPRRQCVRAFISFSGPSALCGAFPPTRHPMVTSRSGRELGY